MKEPTLAPGVAAVLSCGGGDPAKAVRAALGPAAGLLELPPEPMLEPGLTLRQNYRLVKRYSPPEKGKTLEKLLELSGLKKKGWDKPFRKDMDGERQLWKILLTLAMSPGRVLLPDALVGLSGDQRACLDAMLSAWTEEGNTAVLTAGSVKEVLALPSVRVIWLAKGERVLPLGREALEACSGQETEMAVLEALWKGAEA